MGKFCIARTPKWRDEAKRLIADGPRKKKIKESANGTRKRKFRGDNGVKAEGKKGKEKK